MRLAPYGTGNRSLRGSIETTGKFFINQNWKYGWDIALFSDKYFFQDYNIRSSSLGTDYIKESISTAYLTGPGDRSYFDLRGYRIEGLSQFDYNKQQPLVAPVVDYNRTIAVAPDSSYGIGGEVNHRRQPDQLVPHHGGLSVDGYAPARFGVLALRRVPYRRRRPNPALPNFKPPSCFMRGVAGDYTRASAQVSWQRKFIDPIGEVWTPFAFARLDGSWLALNTTDSVHLHQRERFLHHRQCRPDQFLRHQQPGDQRQGRSRASAWNGAIRSSPTTSWASHVVEPIAQVIARPNVSQAERLPNEDAQSLVFDDTTLFSWNKFSGYDRVEGGVRANAGVQYTMNLNSGGSFNTLFGQSYQLAGHEPLQPLRHFQRRA